MNGTPKKKTSPPPKPADRLKLLKLFDASITAGDADTARRWLGRLAAITDRADYQSLRRRFEVAFSPPPATDSSNLTDQPPAADGRPAERIVAPWLACQRNLSARR